MISIQKYRMGRLVTGVAILLFGIPSFAQVTLSANTVLKATSGTLLGSSKEITNLSASVDMSNISLTLTSAAGGTMSTPVGSGIVISSITQNGPGDLTLNGQWTVTNSIVLNNGKIIVDALAPNPGLLTYTGTADLDVGSSSSYIDGLLVMAGAGSGPRTFPIGNASGHFAIRLDAVTDPNTTLIGFEVIDGAPPLTTPSDILEIFQDHYWQMSVTGPFSGSIISVSSFGTDTFFTTAPTGSAAVVQDDGGTATNLNGGLLSGFITTTVPASPTATKFAVGKGTGEISPVIINVMTPNDDGTNDFLAIRNVDFFPENEVTLLDRYGVPIWSKTGFKNYTTNDEARLDYDFSKLSNGNYICTLKYGREGKKIAQMITVLK